MAASYPTSIASYAASVDYATIIDASIDNGQWAEIVAIETALGLNAGTIGGTGQTAGTVGYNISLLASEITTLQNTVSGLGSGTVTSVGAADTSIVISGTSAAPKVATATLDVIATNHPPAANWSNNSKKIMNGAAATLSTDFVILSQLPTYLAPRVTTLTVSSNQYTPSTAYDLCLIVSPTANFTLVNPSGTPVDGQKLLVRVASGSTGYTLTFGGQYISSGIAILPTTALPASKTCTFGFMWDNSRSLWVLMAYDGTGY
jgi:hypothetical protein